MIRPCLLSAALFAGGAIAKPQPYPAPVVDQFAPEPVVVQENPFAIARIDQVQHTRLAHAILVKANPEKESVVTDAPNEVLLTFNEGVGQEFLALAVVDPNGQRVDKHDVHQDFTDHANLRASVKPLAPGRYMVRYRVLSADGHVVSGKYFFEVKAKTGG